MLVGWLCRLCGCTVPSRGKRATTEREAGPEEPASRPREGAAQDDLMAIRGIGKATQNRLSAAGISSYAKLAEATPQNVRAILGRRGRSAEVEDWIAQARRLAGSG